MVMVLNSSQRGWLGSMDDIFDGRDGDIKGARPSSRSYPSPRLRSSRRRRGRFRTESVRRIAPRSGIGLPIAADTVGEIVYVARGAGFLPPMAPNSPRFRMIGGLREFANSIS